MIDDNLQPFWQISPQCLLESIDHISSIETLALRKFEFRNGNFHGDEEGCMASDLGKLFDDVSGDIPDVAFLLNVLEEPREVIDRRMLEVGGVAKPNFTDESHHSIWLHITSLCQETSFPRYEPYIHDYGIPFL